MISKKNCLKFKEKELDNVMKMRSEKKIASFSVENYHGSAEALKVRILDNLAVAKMLHVKAAE